MTAPAEVDADLIAKAREITQAHGEIPSGRALKVALGVGGPKAYAVREHLLAEQPEPTVEITPDPPRPAAPKAVPTWPVLLLALPAFVAIWSGWVDMGRLTGFGVVHPLPGIWDAARLDTAITLPIGLETYAAYALWVWLSGRAHGQAREFAKWSAIGALAVGALGQVGYHLMIAWGWVTAPWPITAAVACLPVAVLGMGAALAHMVKAGEAR